MLGPERIPGIGAVVVGRRQALRADFWRLRSASSISAIGDGLRAAALPLLAAELTRDPQTVALEGVAAGLPWLLLAVAFRLGCGETLFDSAAQAALPTVVPAESLERANGRFYAGNIVGGAFAGAPLGGALFALAAAVPFGLDAGSFLVAALLALACGQTWPCG